MDQKQEREFKFDLSDPKNGITLCIAHIQATDEIQAVGKLVQYFTEKKKSFLRKPNAELNDPKELWDEFARRINDCTDPVAFVLTLHIFCEFWIDQILIKFCPKANLARYDFYKKLEICFGMEKLPDSLWVNLRKLNDLRVKVAHRLNCDMSDIDLNYQACEKHFDVSKYSPSYEPKSGGQRIFDTLKAIMAATYWPLHWHCYDKLSIAKGADGKMTEFLKPAKSS